MLSRASIIFCWSPHGCFFPAAELPYQFVSQLLTAALMDYGDPRSLDHRAQGFCRFPESQLASPWAGAGMWWHQPFKRWPFFLGGWVYPRDCWIPMTLKKSDLAFRWPNMEPEKWMHLTATWLACRSLLGTGNAFPEFLHFQGYHQILSRPCSKSLRGMSLT